ncbi:MAG: hypothetical protein HY023_01855 [Chloroflexi bacterium]|nr:hypothetical protein [Chloroflexota bacterium]
MNHALALSLVSLVSFVSFQGRIIVTDNTASYEFGKRITFTLTVNSAVEVQAITLFVLTSDDSRTQVTEADFTPGTSVTATVERGLRDHPVPPFSAVKYWWRVADASGAELTTDPATLAYEDNRFTWQTAQRGVVTAHWYAGDLAFGQLAADIGAGALERINRDIGAPPPESVDAYIYKSVKDLQGGLELGGRTWVGGHADPALGVVLIVVPPGPEAALGLERDLPHELTHVLIYQFTKPNYAAVPSWLNEGLAVTQQVQPDPTYRLAVQRAQSAGTLLPLTELCGAFPVDAADATLAYAESESVVRYIRDRWGSAKLAALLAAYADGATCAGGTQRVLNTTLAGLENDWARDVLQASPLSNILRRIAPWLLLFLLPLIPLIGLAFASTTKTQRHEDH